MLHYTVKGEGPALVLIHGFLESGDMWSGWMETLSKAYKVVVMDLPAHRHSSYDENESIASMAQKVKAVLDHENIESYQIVGHSMGGYVGIELSLMAPDAYQHLILLNSHASEDSPEKKQMRQKVADFVLKHYPVFVKESIPGLFFKDNLPQLKDVVQEAIQHALPFNPKGIRACVLAMKLRPSHMGSLSEFGKTLSFISGDQDPIMPLSMMQEQSKAINGAQLYTVKNCGHMAHLEKPQQSLKVLLEVLDAHYS